MTRPSTMFITACLLTAGIPAGVVAASGAELHQQHCTSCHDDGVYTRPDHRVTTLEGLRKQVQRCELSLGLKWFDEDIEAVTSYLNDNYYKFK